ncbi:MAG: GreA/GreB family elongation factor [Deltaproteobacteria bacterium]|nr:GreA/GreB family elongation factor [Deltaproteobacteria bacterium]
MSKAFTSGDAQPETVRRAPVKAAPGEERPITPEGRAALEAQWRELVDARAKLLGAESATQRNELDQQIQFVQVILESTRVVVTDASQRDRAFFGATVELEDEQGERVTWRLVGPDEADARTGTLSVASPLGKALLGREVGDEVTVDRPRGKATFGVVAVRY